MRKSIIPASLAIFAMLSVPVHAAKYTCTFFQNNAQKHQCSVDPTTANTSCVYSYNANLNGVCLTGKTDDDSAESFWCWFSAPSANVTSFSVAPDFEANVKTLSEKPGFYANAITVFETKAKYRVLGLGYQESTGSPVLYAACQP